MRKIYIIIGLLVGFALLVFIIAYLNSKADTGEIKIGAVLPLSGPIAQYGKYMKQGLEIALDDAQREGMIRDKTIKLIVEDGQAEPRKSVDAFKKLISSDKIVACIPATSGVTLAMKPIANQNKIVLINASAISNEIEDKNDFIFSVLPNAKAEGEFLAKVAYDTLKKNNAVIVYRDDASGVSFKDSFSKKFQEMGGKILSTESHQPNTNSLQGIVTKVKKLKPSLIFVASWGPEVALFVKQSRELGLNTQIITYETFNSPKVLEIAGNSANGVIFCSPKFNENSIDPKVIKLKESIFKKYSQIEVNYYIAAHYDAMMIILDAIFNGNYSGESIRSYLAKLRQYRGITGEMVFDINGSVMMDLDLYTVKNDLFVKY